LNKGSQKIPPGSWHIYKCPSGLDLIVQTIKSVKHSHITWLSRLSYAGFHTPAGIRRTIAPDTATPTLGLR